MPDKISIKHVLISSLQYRAAGLPSSDSFNIPVRHTGGMHLRCCIVAQVVIAECRKLRALKSTMKLSVQLVGLHIEDCALVSFQTFNHIKNILRQADNPV